MPLVGLKTIHPGSDPFLGSQTREETFTWFLGRASSISYRYGAAGRYRSAAISVGVDRMQRSFEPMRKQVEAWQRSELTDVTAKVVIYEAFVEGKLEAPKHYYISHKPTSWRAWPSVLNFRLARDPLQMTELRQLA